MLIPGETFSESYPAEPGSVVAVRHALSTFARQVGADNDQLDAIRLAASEAVTNAVIHAYDDPSAGTVQVSASYVEDELWLFIADAGNGLKPRSDSPGLGLGLALIAQLADDFQILSRGSGGTELRLRFKLSPDKRRAASRPPESWRPQSVDSGLTPRGSVAAAFSPA